MFAVAVFYMYFTNIFRNMNATKYLFCCVRDFGCFGNGTVVLVDGADGMKHDGAAGRLRGNKARAAGFMGTWYLYHPARDPPPQGEPEKRAAPHTVRIDIYDISSP